MLSAVIITKNAELTIGRTIHSVRFADEIVVIDSGSTDGTQQKAQQLGARVIEHAWEGYGPQKNFGMTQAAGEWLLFIDDDEEVTPELQHRIEAELKNPGKDFYWLRIVTVFLGQPLYHLYGHNPRLFKRAVGQWTNDLVHEQVQTMQGKRIHLGDTESKIIPESLLHYSHDTVASYLEKMHHYTTLDAEQMAKTGRHRSGRLVTHSWTLPPILFMRQLLKLLFYRRGILDGYAGWMWCLLSAYYEWEMARKFLKLL
jgi:glycosyltransferase involved in cell wall biosynthesis